MSPLLICNIGWMTRYEGLLRKPDNIVGGGRFVDENKKGHEVCNFVRCNDGYVYGYVETIKGDRDRQIRIENLGTNSNAESMDEVDVVWVATNPEEGGRRVVGWYRNATVYRHRQKFESFPSPQHKKDGIDTYRSYAKSEDATLLPFEDRSAPALRLGTGIGWIGEANWWFPERQSDPAIKKFVRGLREVINSHGDYVSKKGVKRKWGAGSDVERKAEVERAATNEVKNHYHGYIIESVEKDNVGWDLEAKPRIDGMPLCLEVKGLFGSELKVGLTPNEYRALVKHRDGHQAHYRLCVVTGALSDKPVLKIFRYEVSDNKWFDDVSGKPSALNIVQLEAAIISLASEAGRQPSPSSAGSASSFSSHSPQRGVRSC